MEISGDYRLKAPRQQVWDALNDPTFLQRALPGCEALEKVSDTEFDGKLQSKIGPVKAKFNTKVSLTNLNPPISYTIVGEGKGGASGFAKGSADVTLEEDGAETILRYASQFQVGGKLAQIGNRLVGGAARKTADEFFSNFAALINPSETTGSTTADTEPVAIVNDPEPAQTENGVASEAVTEPVARSETARAAPAAPTQKTGVNPLVWIALVIVIILVLWVIF